MNQICNGRAGYLSSSYTVLGSGITSVSTKAFIMCGGCPQSGGSLVKIQVVPYHGKFSYSTSRNEGYSNIEWNT